jgi:hypothetical protein
MSRGGIVDGNELATPRLVHAVLEVLDETEDLYVTSRSNFTCTRSHCDTTARRVSLLSTRLHRTRVRIGDTSFSL